MDYYENPDIKAASHYEISKDIDRVQAAAAVKLNAFQVMDELEGWCSKFKAGVLVDLVLMLKPEKVVEIGVFGGKSLVPMAVACKANNKGIAVGIDPWSTVASVEGQDGANLSWWGSIDHEGILRGLVDKINKFGLNDRVALVRNTSEGADIIENIDILHVDGNHSERTALFDVKKWVPNVRKGGVIIMDDLNWEGPQKAISWLDASCVRFATFSDNGSDWGIWIKQ